ncbi:MAG: tetratricopeptide repeat protein [Nitrospirae bacterium]|nr:tetratricopeptide repeat protein [Nitrospirota bacterium]
MKWKDVRLKISDGQRKTLKELGSKFAEQIFENLGLPTDDVLMPIRTELSNVINTNPEVKAIIKAAIATDTHYVLRLIDYDNKILNLPWSLAIEFDTSAQIGDIENLHILKTPAAIKDKNYPNFIPNIAAPLKILIMISSPIDLNYKLRLSHEEEEYETLKAFEPLLKTGHVQIDYTDDGSIEALKAKIETNQYHILHFSGHGGFENNKGHLYLENHYTLKGELVNEDDFAWAVNSNSSYKIPLVVLSSANTAQGTSEQRPGGMTGKLLNIGIPSVVSMGMPIFDKLAIFFTTKLYQEISDKQLILEAFTTALKRLKDYEKKLYADENQFNHVPKQWLIPNLYVSREVEHIVNWNSAPVSLKLSNYQYVTEGKQISLAHKAGFMFVGRRAEKAKVFEPFFKNTPIMLKGQGGVGKSTMAEYMVQRAITKNPAKTIPVIITDKVRSIDDVLKVIESAMLKTGSKDMLTATIQSKSIPEAILRVDAVLRVFATDFDPVLVFDNLETFQYVSTGLFKTEYNDIYEVIKHLCSEKIVQLVLTGRYVIPGLANLIEVNLNNIGFNDYWKKCQYLELFEIHHELNKKFYLDTIFDKQEAEFVDLVRFLYDNLGGNFRALEFFNEIYKEKKLEITESLKTIIGMKNVLSAAVSDVRSEMALNLVFNELLKLINVEQRRVLYLLSNFRIPVQMKALTDQPEGADIADLEYLGNLTLIEISTVKTNDTEAIKYYFVTPIIADLLKDHDGQNAVNVAFSNEAAGDYYDDVVNNFGGGLTEHEEAFYHYHKAEVKDKINEIGNRLVNYYYNSSLFATAFHYCKAIYELLGLESDPIVLSYMSIILQLYGDIDGALEIYLEVEKIARATGDKQGEGATLSNIGEIYRAKGDYDSAFKYMLESLKITREIGDKKGDSITLNNISQIYDAKGDYDSALKYLLESLKIIRELGDKKGDSITLNNISQIYMARGDYDSALKYLLESLKITREIGDRKQESVTLNNIGQIYHARGDYDTELKYSLESLKITREIGDKKGEGVTLNNIAGIYNAKGDYDSALQYLLDSLKIRKEIGDTLGVANALFNLAMLYAETGKQNEALQCILEVVEINKTLKNYEVSQALKGAGIEC